MATTSHTPLDPPDAPRGRTRTLARLAVIAVVGTVLVAAGTLIGLRLARAGALPGVTVAGVDVGGKSSTEVRQTLELLAERKSDTVVVAARGGAHYRGVARDLGYEMDIDTTVEQVMYRGRQGNPITALADHLRSFRSSAAATLTVEAAETVDHDTLAAWVEDAVEALERPPREGRLRFDGAEIKPVMPRAGATVDPDALLDRMTVAVLEVTGDIVEAPTTPVEPETTEDAVTAVLSEAETAVSDEVTLRRRGAAVTLSPDDIGDVLATRPDGAGGLELYVDPDELTTTIGATAIADFSREAESARFEVSGDTINLIKGHNGFTYDADLAAQQLLTVATEDADRRATLTGDIEQADLTNHEAKKLKIVEQVSSFTTYHACCESRVTNIHRIADIVDDVVLEPGETFSVNDFVGERTEAKGFVGGGAIFEGEFVEQIGGGVSQFATTTYNAVFFGGYQIDEHKAHSYYISRYPEGREATLNYPNVDLKFTNNSPYGMVISTSYTEESITVSTYGKKWVEVDTTTGPRTNLTQPETQYRENDELPKGKQRVIQEAGAGGFDITVTRTLTFPDGTTKREEIFTRYLPQPQIIERNT
jgi:vancomycin resistance protein YoaR